MFITPKTRDSLNLFFNEALTARKESIFKEDGCQLKDWLSNEDERKRLTSMCSWLDKQPEVQNGIHATAYIFDHYVIKTNIFDPYYRDGQMSWLKWVNRNQTNPLVPRIQHLVVDEDTERFIVVMEKLEPHHGFKHHSFRKEIDCALKVAFEREGRFPALRRLLAEVKAEALLAIEELWIDVSMLDTEDDVELIDMMRKAIDEHHQTVLYIEQVQQFGYKLNTTYRQHFRAIKNKFVAAISIGQYIDVHSLNWMLRSNGEPVFLDPIN